MKDGEGGGEEKVKERKRKGKRELACIRKSRRKMRKEKYKKKRVGREG